jgi:hypothetical protein
MKYVEEVDNVPRRLLVANVKPEYEMILREFLDSGTKIARVRRDVIAYKPSKHSPSDLLAQGLRRTAKRLHFPILVKNRMKEVYLIRT